MRKCIDHIMRGMVWLCLVLSATSVYAGKTGVNGEDLARGFADWSMRREEGIKYFSCTAVFAKKISTSCMSSADERVILDPDHVKNFGDATVNGVTYSMLRKPPFRIDITDVVRQAGSSRVSLQMTVKITNLWPNRMIGDDYKPADRKFEQGKIIERNLIEWPQFIQEEQPLKLDFFHLGLSDVNGFPDKRSL